MVKKSHNYVWAGLVGIVAAAGLFFVFGKSGVQQVQIVSTATVQIGDIANRVLVFGKAAPEDIFELSFDVGGKMTSYNYDEGDQIKKDSVIAKLDSRTVRSQIARANSGVSIERSRLSDLAAPVSVADQASKIAEIEKQRLVTTGEETDLRIALGNALEVYRDNLGETIDKYYLYPTGENTILRFKEATSLSDADRSTLSAERIALEDSYNQVQQITEVSYKYNFVQGLFAKTKSLADSLSAQLDQENSISASQTRDKLEDFNDTLDDLFESLSADYVAWTTAVQQVVVLENQLAALQTGADASSLALQQSVIRSKQSDLSALYTDLSKLTLKSPIDGVVFDAPLNNYQTVNAGTVVLAIIRDEPLVVFADIAESDVQFVGLGNPAELTFDALPDQTFTGIVSEIKNRENLGATVPTYKTTFVFADGQEVSSVRSGMTANITVSSGMRDGVLYVPTSYVDRTDGQATVQVQTIDGSLETRSVQLGLTTTAGLSEINSGLNAGDNVVIVK